MVRFIQQSLISLVVVSVLHFTLGSTVRNEGGNGKTTHGRVTRSHRIVGHIR